MKQLKLNKNEEAVSPVIAVILMVAITVVLAAVLYTWALSFIRSDKQTPTVGAVYQPFGNNDFAIHVEKVDPDAVSVISVNYILLDDRGTAVPGVQGSVKDIYGLNFDDQYTNVSFQDNDRDGKISAGDVFLIKNAVNDGQASAGYALLLKFDVTGDKMNGGGTKLG
jgi:archaeal type IV pilus assembly protein PilA